MCLVSYFSLASALVIIGDSSLRLSHFPYSCEGGGMGILIIKRQNMSREARIIIKTNQRSLELSEPTKEAKNYQNQLGVKRHCCSFSSTWRRFQDLKSKEDKLHFLGNNLPAGL